ncbi:MAG TPA: hypothetical protein VFL97_02060 [Nitrococcus sp.]|nr:hypothetical protein [Nitrococcus sp.]
MNLIADTNIFLAVAPDGPEKTALLLRLKYYGIGNALHGDDGLWVL